MESRLCQSNHLLKEEELIKVLRSKSHVNRAFGTRTGYTYRIGDLLNWFDIIARDEFVVSIKKLDSCLLKRPLSKQQTFDPGET